MLKQIAITIAIVITLTYTGIGFSAIREPEIKKTTIDLSTNMVCRMAERIMEKALNKVDGVIEIDIDPESKTMVVTYDDEKTSVSNIEKAITNTGYDANDKKGDPEAYEKLPDCCKIK